MRKRWGWRGAALVLTLLAWSWAAGPAWGERHCFLVRGALGDAAFEEPFDEMESGWRQAAEQAGDVQVRTLRRKEELREALAGLRPEKGEELWIVLIGHGTDDGKSAKFNLEGEDLSAAELAAWVEGWTKPLVVVNSASASGGFVSALSGPERIVVTATQSGQEVFAPKFGLYLARALLDPEADLDRDGAVSVLEAVVVAAHRVGAYYEAGNRLATEHALIDDNGDRRGTRADWFEGLKLTRQVKGDAEADGQRARQIALVRGEADRLLTEEQRRRRDELERKVEALKRERGKMEEEAFWAEAEGLLLELGRLYREGMGKAES